MKIVVFPTPLIHRIELSTGTAQHVVWTNYIHRTSVCSLTVSGRDSRDARNGHIKG